MTCKGICASHKASGRYATGNKRCTECNLFIKWEGFFCPCCGHKFRIGPRVFKFKEKLRIKKRMQKVQNKTGNMTLHA